MTNAGVPVVVISDETEAIQYALDNAKANSFIAVSTDAIYESIDYIRSKLAKEEENFKELDRLFAKN
jgi:UDP-N-acetylmuramyl tripeptide synthase